MKISTQTDLWKWRVDKAAEISAGLRSPSRLAQPSKTDLKDMLREAASNTAALSKKNAR